MDKVQKIHEEVKRLKSLIGNNSFLSDYEKGCNDGREDMCDEIISIIDSLQEESVWHNVEYQYDETKAVLIVAIDHTLHLWKGKFDTDKMCSAFRLFTGTDCNNKPSSIVSKWAYLDDLLKF